MNYEQPTHIEDFEFPIYSPEPFVDQSERPSIEIGMGKTVTDLIKHHTRSDNPAIIDVQSA